MTPPQVPRSCPFRVRLSHERRTDRTAAWSDSQKHRDRLASGGGRRSRSQPVASHDLADPREVGWPTAGIGEHSGDLAEVVGAEHSRRDDRKRLRVQVAAVIEMMDRAARYAQRLTRSHLDGRVLDRPRGNALEAVDRLFEAVVAVRGGHLAARRDSHFEHRHTSTRVSALDEEANGRVAEADQLAFHCADPTTHRLGRWTSGARSVCSSAKSPPGTGVIWAE